MEELRAHAATRVAIMEAGVARAATAEGSTIADELSESGERTFQYIPS